MPKTTTCFDLISKETKQEIVFPAGIVTRLSPRKPSLQERQDHILCASQKSKRNSAVVSLDRDIEKALLQSTRFYISG